MKEQLQHIFDVSVCLTRRQMKDYIGGTMSAEECHAAEHHINTCPLCSEAVDGMVGHPQDALAAISELDSNVLKKYFDAHTPQVHLNSLTPVSQAADYSHGQVKTKMQKRKAQIAIRNTFIAVVILLALGLIWYLKFGKGT